MKYNPPEITEDEIKKGYAARNFAQISILFARHRKFLLEKFCEMRRMMERLRWGTL
jgi:hypothetical protein